MQRSPVLVLEPSELSQHEPLLDGGEKGLEHGRLEEPGILPLPIATSPTVGAART